MKYVIMADGKMTRWHMACGIPKHMIQVDGETLLARLVRQLHTFDEEARVIITSHNPLYEVEGAERYEPQNNHMEIDRFTWELIEDDICFLYGDTYYTDQAVQTICQAKTEGLGFIGTDKSIVALLAHDADLLREHITRVKEAFLNGKCRQCRGWEVYQSYTGQLGAPLEIGAHFTRVSNETCGFNSYQDYENFINKKKE